MRGAVMRMDSREYAKALEDERRKIQVFQRELPLCFELVTQAIESCRQQLSETTTEELNGVQSDCSEQLSREVSPVLEEFIPVKRSVSSDSDDEEQQSARKINKSTDEKILGQSDWLRSAQLWNQTPNLLDKQDGPKKGSVMEVKRNGGAFQPFHREKTVDEKKIEASVVAKAPSSATPTAETGSGSGGSGGSSRGEGREGSSQRKQRRCWSPELHRRFLHALQQLGGSQCATPKQIRELMKVDGLTNDEVKSHLQKYRLHTRRPSHVMHGNNSCSSSPAEAAHLVVVGGIWVSPPEYAAAMVAATGKPGSVAATNGGGGVYAPVALPPPQQPPRSVVCNDRPQARLSNSNQSESEEKRVISISINPSEGGASARSISPSLSSSSTHTAT